MLTQKKLISKIDGLFKEASLLSSGDSKEKKKIKSRIAYLKQILNYLRTNPTEEFVKKSLEDQEQFLKVINDRFEALPAVTWKEAKKAHEDKYGVANIKKHIKNLKFILEK